jgi:hypothetical protein
MSSIEHERLQGTTTILGPPSTVLVGRTLPLRETLVALCYQISLRIHFYISLFILYNHLPKDRL